MQDDIVKMPPQQLDEQKPEQKVVQDVVIPPKTDTRPPATSDKKLPHEKATEETNSSKPAKKSNSPKGVVAVAGLFCACLIGLAVFIALDGTKSKNAPAASTAQNTTESVKPTVPDVQGAIQETEQLPEPADDPEAELSDETLGL